MIESNGFHFYKPVENIEESIAILKSYSSVFETVELTAVEKVKALDKIFRLVNDKIPMELGELWWSVETLESEKGRNLLLAASNALKKLQFALERTNAAIPSENAIRCAGVVGREIDSLSVGPLADLVKATDKKLADSMMAEGLPTYSEMEGADWIPTSEADLILSKKEAKPNNYQHVSQDFPERVGDIIGMMKGERMNTAPREIFDDSGSIADKNGEYVLVPSAFAADLPRMKLFKINEATYVDSEHYDSYNPNECAREIYRLLGKTGGERLMQACQQGTMAHFISHMVYPLISPDALWGKALAEKFIAPSNASGFVVDLVVDSEKNQVVLSRKLLMKLHTRGETAFTAHFVAKTEIRIPLDELTRSDFIENADPAPNLHVTDTISALVIDKPEIANELLNKF